HHTEARHRHENFLLQVQFRLLVVWKGTVPKLGHLDRRDNDEPEIQSVPDFAHDSLDVAGVTPGTHRQARPRRCRVLAEDLKADLHRLYDGVFLVRAFQPSTLVARSPNSRSRNSASSRKLWAAESLPWAAATFPRCRRAKAVRHFSPTFRKACSASVPAANAPSVSPSTSNWRPRYNKGAPKAQWSPDTRRWATLTSSNWRASPGCSSSHRSR